MVSSSLPCLALLAPSAALATLGALGPTVTLRGGGCNAIPPSTPAVVLTCTALATETLCNLNPLCKYATGVVMPTVGLGSSGGCGPDSFGTADGSPCAWYNASSSWFKHGGRAVHDALSYGNQFGVGAAFRDSGLGRTDVFLMTMVPKYLMGFNETLASVEASLAQMQLAHLDLVMVHHRAADISDWPREASIMAAFPNQPKSADGKKAVWGPPPCALADPTWRACQDETWRALTLLKKQGKVRAIGVSNWPIASLQRMEALGQELPAVNQVEVHIGYHENDLIDFCRQRGILVQAATPLARSLPQLVKLGADPTVSTLAAKYKKSPAQVALRFLLELGVAPIPSAKTLAYQLENLDVFDFALTPAETAALGKLTFPCRGNAADGLQKCWADPSSMMCQYANGSTFHCP
jgi:diketogulonate reductase-like aldo/keto reductase